MLIHSYEHFLLANSAPGTFKIHAKQRPPAPEARNIRGAKKGGKEEEGIQLDSPERNLFRWGMKKKNLWGEKTWKVGKPVIPRTIQVQKYAEKKIQIATHSLDEIKVSFIRIFNSRKYVGTFRTLT